MLNENLVRLRKIHHFTQEEIAEKLGVSRQSVAKWESGETMPDIHSCMTLAELYDVTVENLVHHSEKESGMTVPPRGKHFFGAVTVGERGQIVIPKKARDVFHIKPGDKLLILGDEERGLAILFQKDLLNFVGIMGLGGGRDHE